MTYIRGDYYMICQRSGEKIRRSQAVRDAYGYIVKAEYADERHPQENIPPPRVERQPVFVSPEGVDTFLGGNDVQESDF